MKKRTSALSFGPGASSLILIFVVLSMTVLGMLSLLSARNDRGLSARSIQVVQAQYALNQKAEERLAEIGGLLSECHQTADSNEAYLNHIRERLPDDVTLEGNELSYSVTDGTRTLRCRLYINDFSTGGTTWLLHSLTSETGDETIWN